MLTRMTVSWPTSTYVLLITITILPALLCISQLSQFTQQQLTLTTETPSTRNRRAWGPWIPRVTSFPRRLSEISYRTQNRSNEILGGWRGWGCIGIGSRAFGTAFRPCIKSARPAKLTVTLDGGEEFVFGVFDASRRFASRSMSLLLVILVMSKSLELGGFSMSTPSALHCYGNSERHLLQSEKCAYHSRRPH